MNEAAPATATVPVANPTPVPATAPAATPTGTPAATPAAQTPAHDGLFDTKGDPATDRPEWLQEKYKSVEEQAKGYGELYKRFLEKNGVPEKYDLGTAITESGITIRDEAALTEFQNQMREHGLNQRQADWLVRRYGTEINTVIGQYEQELAKLRPANLADEKGKLEQLWGQKYADNIQAVSRWAKANLAPDVVNALSRSAEGAKFVFQLMNGQKGPVPISDTAPVTAASPAELLAEREKIQKDPEYRKNSALGRQLQAKALELTKRLNAGAR